MSKASRIKELQHIIDSQDATIEKLRSAEEQRRDDERAAEQRRADKAERAAEVARIAKINAALAEDEANIAKGLIPVHQLKKLMASGVTTTVNDSMERTTITLSFDHSSPTAELVRKALTKKEPEARKYAAGGLIGTGWCGNAHVEFGGFDDVTSGPSAAAQGPAGVDRIAQIAADLRRRPTA